MLSHQQDAAAVAGIEAPDRALDLRMAGVADQHDLARLARKARHFHVHLGDQRTGGIEHLQPASLCLLLDGGRHAVRREDHRGAVRHLIEFLDEHARPGRAAARPRGGCAPPRGARRSARRTARSARSTISIARSTPAQNPRGLASRMCMVRRASSVRRASRGQQAIEQQQPAPTVMAESATLKAGK